MSDDMTIGENELRAILDGLEGVTPGVMGAMVSAMGSRRHRCTDIGAPDEQAASDYNKAVWLADNMPSIRSIVTELLDRRKDGLGTVSVKPLEWHEVTSPREDGPAEPTGDWEAESIAGKYFIQLWEDHYELNDPDGDYVENWLGGLEEAFTAADADHAARVKSCLTSIGVEAGK